ncbi:hypothetical protein BC834DRAFT_868995 [Gloeopeniophorella convolvens]|nr:hypothetical protein BC834DRAFT_868995 [Gloeopeniophorella convolvens]
MNMIPATIYNFLSSPTAPAFAKSTSSTPSLPPPLETTPSAFALLLERTELPPPGPEHFAARRALWTTPTAGSRLDAPPSPSRIKLETLLDQPGALESQEVWNVGLSKVWKGLIGGGRLKNFLPLRAVVKILYAGWRRDGTWPEQTSVADEDDFFGTTELQTGDRPAGELTPGVMSDVSSSVTRSDR